MGLSRSAVNYWEMGVNVPSANYLIELSRIFNTSIDYILDVRGEETIDITSLSKVQKKIIYSLVNEFKKSNNAKNMLKHYKVNIDNLNEDDQN